MKTSEAIDKLAEALAKAQGAMTSPVADTKVDMELKSGRHMKYNYANLSGVIEASRKPLSDNGLCIVQTTEGTEAGNYLLVTRLIHASGQWIESYYLIPGGLAPQDMASQMSYGRRYSRNAILDMSATDDDDDGAQAQDAHRNAPQAHPARPIAIGPTAPPQSAGPANLGELYTAIWNDYKCPKPAYLLAMGRITNGIVRDEKTLQAYGLLKAYKAFETDQAAAKGYLIVDQGANPVEAELDEAVQERKERTP